MPWNKTTRREYARHGRRYASDVADREWALVAPFLPARKKIGRPRTTDLRDVYDAILYMASTGCQWAFAIVLEPMAVNGSLPNDFPPPSTVQRYFYDWCDSGLLWTINHHLVMEARELEGREASPSAGVIDSQSVKTTESGGVCGGACPRAGAAGPGGRRQEDQGPQARSAWPRTDGGSRLTVTDTLGLMVGLIVHGADIQDRDGAPEVLKSIRHAFPWLRHVFADGGYAGPKLRGKLAKIGDWTIEIVKRLPAD